MKCEYACGTADHSISRRNFLGSVAGAAGAFGFNNLIQPSAAKALKASDRRVLLVWLAGGVSQLETWDPKPGTATGGPFQTIQTSVPGVHISELLPHTAKHMHNMALVRGINTRENNHGKGAYFMHTGRKQEPAMQYPHLGSVMAKLLTPAENPLPGYIHVSPKGGGKGKDAAFLGPKYNSIVLSGGNAPQNIDRPGNLSLEVDRQRNAFRAKLDQRFAKKRRTADTEAYTESYEMAAQLMARKEVFDISKAPPREIDRYGQHDFGRHCFLAKRLLENGVTFVKVTHTNYDTHHENFDFHIEQLGEFDKPFGNMLDDLTASGLLDNTLVIVMSEFGRTPKINRNYGRDHWGTAWSVALAGCGIKGGAVVGKTNAGGTAVTDRQVHGGHLFHTYFSALGLNSKRNHYVDNRPIPMADPKAEAITEILA